jgi:hypothetical protein
MKITVAFLLSILYFCHLAARPELSNDGTAAHIPAEPKSKHYKCDGFLKKREKAIMNTLTWCKTNSNSSCIIKNPTEIIPSVLVQSYSEIETERNLLAKNQLGISYDAAANYLIFPLSAESFYLNCKDQTEWQQKILIANEKIYGACARFTRIRADAIQKALSHCNSKFKKIKTDKNDNCAVIIPEAAFPHVALRSMINKAKEGEQLPHQMGLFPSVWALSALSLPEIEHFKSCPQAIDKTTWKVKLNTGSETAESQN